MFGRLTPLVKNLLIIINIGLFFISFFFLSRGISLNDLFGLYYVGDDNFSLFSSSLICSSIRYLMLERTLSVAHLRQYVCFIHFWLATRERFLGQKKFLILYMVTGVGAGFYTAVNFIEVRDLEQDYEYYIQNPSPQGYLEFMGQHADDLTPVSKEQIYGFADAFERSPNDTRAIQKSIVYVSQIYNIFGTYSMVGASGAIFGILAAFALFFPNTELFLLFLPFPVKAKYLVSLYILYEVYAELQRAPGDNVAHLAHIGGINSLVRYLKAQRNDFY